MVNTQTFEDTAQEVREGYDEAVSGSQKIRKQIQQAGQKVKTQAQDTWDDTTDLIRKHPGKAVGITLAAGFALGTLAAALSAPRRRSSGSDSLRNLADSGVDAWDKVREGFAEATCTLKNAVEEALAKFK